MATMGKKELVRLQRMETMPSFDLQVEIKILDSTITEFYHFILFIFLFIIPTFLIFECFFSFQTDTKSGNYVQSSRSGRVV